MSTNRIALTRLKAWLTNRFQGRIDLADVATKQPKDQESAFFTRALAAFALMVHARCTAEQAASAIVDGYDDNGIDAIFLTGNECYLVQSKFSHDWSASLKFDAVDKLRAGVESLTSLDFSQFNKKVTNRQDELSRFIESPAGRLRLVFVFNGDQAPAEAVSNRIESMVTALNEDYNDIVDGPGSPTEFNGLRGQLMGLDLVVIPPGKVVPERLES